MVSRKILVTRSSKQRRSIENAKNAPVKKMRVTKMKQLANEYIRKEKSMINNFNFNLFYKQNKTIYPWLQKEAFRWHVRSKKVNKLNKNDYSTTSSDISNESDDSLLDSTSQVSHDFQIREISQQIPLDWGWGAEAHFAMYFLEA